MLGSQNCGSECRVAHCPNTYIFNLIVGGSHSGRILALRFQALKPGRWGPHTGPYQLDILMIYCDDNQGDRSPTPVGIRWHCAVSAVIHNSYMGHHNSVVTCIGTRLQVTLLLLLVCVQTCAHTAMLRHKTVFLCWCVQTHSNARTQTPLHLPFNIQILELT